MMKLKLSKVFLFLIGIFTMWSCEFKESTIDPIIVSNIDTEFSIQMYENLNPYNRSLSFNVESIDETNCLNGTISYAMSSQKENLDLVIKEVVDPVDCSPGVSTYHSDVYIGQLKDDKVYNLTVSLQDIVENHGFLIVDDEKYSIELNSLYGLKIENTVLYKIPKSLVWGYCAIQNLNQQSTADTFLGQLSGHGTPISMKSGDYGHFQVLPSGQLVGFQTIIDNPVTILPFVFSFTGDWEELTNEASAFRDAHPNIEVKLLNGVGEEF